LDVHKWEVSMNIRGIVVSRTYTDAHEEMARFFREVLGLTSEREGPGSVIFRMPDTSRVGLFGPAHGDHHGHERFTTAPVPEFLVDDIVAARDELEAAGVELLGPLLGDPATAAWQHFRAPDGNVYGLAAGDYRR
jgi:predicted enzyme related to lactoylglutathione lyase